MTELNPWELLYYKLKNSQFYHPVLDRPASLLSLADFPKSAKSSFQKKRCAGKSDFRGELILCTICDSIIINNRLANHFRCHHKAIGTPLTDLYIAVSPSHSCLERSLSFDYSENLQTFTTNSTNLEPSNTYRHDILKECFPPSWNHDDERGRTPQAFTSSSSFNASIKVSGTDVSVNAPVPVENNKLEDGNSISTAPHFLDFYDIFPDTSDLYNNKCVKNMSSSSSTAPENEISLADLKDSNDYFKDLLHSTTQDDEAEKTSNTISHRSQAVSQSMNAYLSALHEPEPYLPVGRSETSDCQSHTLETPSPDFFTLPSASSSSTYSVDSSVFNNTEANSQCLTACFPDQSVYGKNYENKSPPTSMPILVRFNNPTPARMHGETDVEVEQAVAAIVDLEDEPAEKKTSDRNPVSEQPPDEQKSDEKLPILSPMNAMVNSVSDHPTSNGWMDSNAVSVNGTADIDWEIWDSLELPSCDCADGDTSEPLPLLKPNDFLSSLEPYLPESNESQEIYEVSMTMGTCQVQQQQQELQHQEQVHLPQPVFPIEQSTLVPLTGTTTEKQTIVQKTTIAESKPSKNEGSSRSRRPMDCMNGSLPLHLWPFDPRLHCGVQRDGTVCRRSLLCKLHSMGLKRQVERPQDIGLLVKQLREAKRLKKLAYPKPENSEDSISDRRTTSSAFILPSTSSHSVDPLRSKTDRHSPTTDSGGIKCISGVTPIKPAIEVTQAQPFGGISVSPNNITASAQPTFVRCAYTGNQLQISTGLISNHAGLHIIEKPLQIQSATFPQVATGMPIHSGLTVISEGIQATPLHCDQSLFSHRSGGTVTPYLQFDQTGNRTAANFLQNRQLCTVIGAAQKATAQYETSVSTASAGAQSATTSVTPTNGFLTLNPTQQVPGTQAATIIVGHPEGNTGTVQYANDKVDSINLLSPSAGPGCISLPPRSARVFQLILPQSATALSLRPHPGSMGSASVIQLTTTGSSNLGTATIPLKQNPVSMLETGIETQTANTSKAITIEESRIQEATAIELQPSGEVMDSHKTIHPDSSSLMTVEAWEQLHKNGSLVLPTSCSIGFTEVPASAATISATLENSTENNFEIGRIPVANNYDSAPSIIQQQQSEEKGEEDTTSWLEFHSPSNIAEKDTSRGSTGSGSFVEPLPLVRQSQSNSDQEMGDKKSTNSSTKQHSKLRVLLFDMEDEDDLEEEPIPDVESMTVEDTDLDSSRIDSRGTPSEVVQMEKLNEGRLFKGCSLVGTTTNLPTAIVAPTAFSMATNNSANSSTTNSGVCGGGRSNKGSPTCCISDELTMESSKDKPNTPLPANKRKHCQENGFHSVDSGSASPLKQKKSDDSVVRLTSPAITASSITTTSSTITSGSSLNTRMATNTAKIMTSTYNTMDLAAPLKTGTILSLQPPSAGNNRLSVSTTRQMESIAIPVSSAVNCGGNIIICSGTPATQHQQQSQAASIGAWNYQLKNLDSRSSPLTLIRLSNGQLAAVPNSVIGGTQATISAPPLQPTLPTPPPQQTILQSHGATLVLRYPQQQQKAGEQFDINQGTMDASAANTTNLMIVNGNYQFQQAPHYQQQQQLVMLSSGGKSPCYSTACDHLNDLNSNSVNGNFAMATCNPSNSSPSGTSVDQVNAAQASQPPTVATTFQQASGTVARHPQLQSVPAGAMTVFVRVANSQSTLQLLIPQPDGTMVLQPATLQNQFCNRTTGVAASNVSLIPQSSPQIQSSQQQQNQTGVFSQPLLQTGYISVPRGGETAPIFHSATGSICAGGQFTSSTDDGSGNASAPAGSGSRFVELFAANETEGSRSILSPAGDLSKWIRNGSSNAKVIGGGVSTNQQIFHQQACLDSSNPTIIQLPQAAGRASINQRQQKQEQQVVFLTAPSGAGTTAAANHHTSFGNVAAVVQQSTGLEHSRGVWATSSATSGTAVTLPNPSQN